MKVKYARDVKRFQDIPNIRPAVERDFRLLGLKEPKALKNKNPSELYKEMCKISGVRQDSCVLDTYMAAIDFMNGAPARSWWSYTKKRKREYSEVTKLF